MNDILDAAEEHLPIHARAKGNNWLGCWDSPAFAATLHAVAGGLRADARDRGFIAHAPQVRDTGALRSGLQDVNVALRRLRVGVRVAIRTSPTTLLSRPFTLLPLTCRLRSVSSYTSPSLSTTLRSSIGTTSSLYYAGFLGMLRCAFSRRGSTVGAPLDGSMKLGPCLVYSVAQRQAPSHTTPRAQGSGASLPRGRMDNVQPIPSNASDWYQERASEKPLQISH
jgi:hypothetical protein